MDQKAMDGIKLIARKHLAIDEICRNGHVVIVNNVLAPKVMEALIEAYYFGRGDGYEHGLHDGRRAIERNRCAREQERQ